MKMHISRNAIAVAAALVFGLATFIVQGPMGLGVANAGTLRRPGAGGGAAVATDVFKVTYFDVATAEQTSASGAGGDEVGGDGDGIVRIVNPTSNPVLCAMIYVFDDAEEEQECCGCPVTTEGLRTLSTAKDLTANPLSGKADSGYNIPAGLIKVVSSLPNQGTYGCDAALPLTPTPALRAWSTHWEEVSENETISGQAFKDAPLDATDEATLVSVCAGFHTNGSGAGSCSCGSGDDYPSGPHSHHG